MMKSKILMAVILLIGLFVFQANSEQNTDGAYLGDAGDEGGAQTTTATGSGSSPSTAISSTSTVQSVATPTAVTAAENAAAQAGQFGDKDLDDRIKKIKAEYRSEELRLPGEVDQTLSSCKQMRDSAQSNCNIINPQTLALLGIVGNIGSSAASSNSVASKCEAAGMVNTLATGANGAFGAICLRSAGSCIDTGVSGSCAALDKSSSDGIAAAQEKINSGCGFVADTQVQAGNEQLKQLFLKNLDQCEQGKVELKKEKAINLQARNLAGECTVYKNQSYQYLIQAAASAAAVAASAQCVSTAKSQANQMNALIGSGSCTNDPLKRQTADCICLDPTQRTTNSICAGWNGGAGGGGNTPGLAGGAGGTNRNALAADPGINALKEMGNQFKGAGAGNNTQLSNGGVGGQGTGGPQGGQLGALNPDEAGGQPGDLKTDIDQGYQRTRGGGDSLFGSSGRGGYGGGGDNGSGKKSAFDLSQYLPWMKKKPAVPERQISTAGLKAEGVTGAAGPSIWEKVTNRMQMIRGRLQ